MLYVNKNNLTSYFLICIPLISSPCLIAMVRISNAMLSGSGENRYSCLFPNLRVKTFHLSPVSMISAVAIYKIEEISLYS